jgi:hypothetical protein
MKHKMSLEDRIAYARRLRVTWHVVTENHAVWFVVFGAWRAGIVKRRDRDTVTVASLDAPDGLRHVVRYVDLRWRMPALDGRDVPENEAQGHGASIASSSATA